MIYSYHVPVLGLPVAKRLDRITSEFRFQLSLLNTSLGAQENPNVAAKNDILINSNKGGYNKEHFLLHKNYGNGNV